MTTHTTLEKLKKEILLLIDYAAQEDQKESANELLCKMQTDRIALNILKEFYSFLPEAENDSILRIQLLDSRHKTFLLLVSTNLDKYFYLANLERAEFLGRHKEGIWDEEVLDFFDLDREESLQKFQNPEDFSEYIPLGHSQTHCMVCSAKTGEEHRLGCPVEICPWCNGQLTHCNCRYTQVGSENISSQKQIEKFQEILDKKGRIPFDASQKLGGLRE